MEEIYFAKEVSVENAEQRLEITWGDGHKSVYSLSGLRLACPCATCAGGHEFMGREVDKAIFRQNSKPDRKIANLKEVGNYALQIIWLDGHDAGFYRWDQLRNWCACETCYTP